MRRILIAAVIMGICILSAPPADAWLKVCNHTESKVEVAIAYSAKGEAGVSVSHATVLVEGWWEFVPGECAQVKDLRIADNWTYYYATGKDGRRWGGSSFACVRNKEFTLQDSFRSRDGRCPAAGWRLEGFGRIDSNAANYTLNFR